MSDINASFIRAASALAISSALACQAGPGEAENVARVESALNTTFADSHYSDGNGWTAPQYYSTLRYPDLNNDGHTDVCGRGKNGIWCATDNGSGQFVGDGLWTSSFSDAAGWSTAPYYSTIGFPDLNGDGKADVCGRSPNGIVCGLSSGSAFGTVTTWSTNYTDGFGWGQPQYYKTISYPDVNGDGKADVCGRGSGGIWCALSTGTTFGTATFWSSSFGDGDGWTAPQYYSTISFPDINGDGKADVCGRGPSGIMCALSNGSSFPTAAALWSPNFSDAAGWAFPQYYSTIQFSDVDGDGKADACGRGGGGMLCGTSTGSAFNTPTMWDGSYSDTAGWTAPQYYSTLHIVKGVLCGRASDGIYCSFSNGSSFANRFLDSTNESDANGWTQPQYYTTVTVTRDLKLAARGAGGVWTGPVYEPDNLSINTVADLNARRTALITKVWGRSTIDTTQGVDSDTPSPPLDVQNLPAGATVERYASNMPTSGGVPIAGGPAAVQGLADLFMPAGGSSKLVILNPGHYCYYTPLPFQGSQAVTELVAEGYAVLATYMPRLTPLDCTDITKHTQLFDPAQNFRPAGGGHPLIYFLDPVRRSLNHAIAKHGYSQIYMAGLSGGGWTTTVYSALDTRITTSVPIAGTQPFNLRAVGGIDVEQENEPASGNDFFSFSSGSTQFVTGYKDLYLLGSYGNGRQQIQVLNRNDDCCFGQQAYAGVSPPWDQAVRGYESEVRQRIYALGAGAFRVEINEADDCTMTNNCGSGNAPARHEFSKNARVGVILAELGGGYSSIGVANDTTAFARGMNGHLYWSNGAGGWTDTNLPMIGTAAIIKGAANPYDIFYRDPTNKMVHAYYNGASWIAVTDISGTIISDPVATSWGSGRIDVVAVGTDYRVYHWFWNNVAWSLEQVTAGSPFAVGPVALTSWGPSRLDIFYRGHDANLYHVSSNGAAPYAQEWTGGTIRQFPAATTAVNALWPYVTGTDGRLYQGQQLNGGSWTWVQVSAAPISGGPGVFRSSTGVTKLYERTTTGQLGLFSWTPPGTSWTFINEGGGPFLGSPVATDLGGFFLDVGHSVWQFDGTTWHGQGGYIER